jgi:hypothetical protein
LLINDHVLKGSGLLPSWLTGKISDFAGMIVAPLAAVALTHARSSKARILIFAMVVLPFVLVKLSSRAADALSSCLTVCGIPSRIWADPTDLVALVVIPFAWRLLHAEASLATGRDSGRWFARVGALLGGLACLATSYGEAGYASLYLTNVTRHPVQVAIHRASLGSCNTVNADSDVPLAEGRFTFERCVELGPFGLVTLDPPGTTAGIDPARSCDAVAIVAQNLGAVGVWWGDTTVVPVSSTDSEGEGRSERGLRLLQVGGELFVHPAPISLTWTFPRETGLLSCGTE